MTTFVATFAMLAALMAMMAVGVVFSGRRLRGSCGGVQGKDCSCSVTDRKACERKEAAKGIVPAEDDGHRHLDMLDDDLR